MIVNAILRAARDLWYLAVLLVVALWCACTKDELSDRDREALGTFLLTVGTAVVACALVWRETGSSDAALAAATVICAGVYAWCRRPADPRVEVTGRIERAIVDKTKTDPETIPQGLVTDQEWRGDARDPGTRGLTYFRGHYDRHYADGKRTNLEALFGQVQSNLGSRVRFEFTPHTEFNYFEAAAAGLGIPSGVLWLELSAGAPWHIIPYGVGERGLEVIDLRRTPHVLWTSSTGAGKTNGMRVAAAQQLANPYPWRIRVCDPKEIELLFLEGMPGVEVVASEPDDMVRVVRDTKLEMDAWYRSWKAGRNPKPLGIALYVDEVAEFSESAPPEWKRDLASLLRKSRRSRTHLFLATQRFDTEFVPGEARSNIKHRQITGPLDEQGSRMTLGDAKLGQGPEAGGKASSAPGRLLVSDDGQLKSVQGYYVADPVYLNPDIPPERARVELARAAKLFPTPAPRPAPAVEHDDDQGDDEGPVTKRRRTA